MADRTMYVRFLAEAMSAPESEADSEAAIEALLQVAATRAAALSRNSVGFPQSHIEEALGGMVNVLEETFDIELFREQSDA